MNHETVKKLNQLNLDFYNKTGEYFDRSRKYFWSGWERLIKNEELRIKNVLDLGCGNGRFYEFLEKNLGNEFEYLGLDSNEYLLEVARDCYESIQFEDYDLIEDLLEDKKELESFNSEPDFIVLFGVMHHIPSFDMRKKLVKKLADILTKDGVLVVSLWNFLDDSRIKNKTKDWASIGVLVGEVEENDYILGWDRGVEAFRYCHYFNEEEINLLVEESGLKVVDKFKADGKSGELNTYLVLKKV